MTVHLFQLTDEGVAVLTDTMACDADGDPAFLVDKCHVLPHLNIAITANGFGGLMEEVVHALRTSWFVRDIEAFNEGAQPMLEARWESLQMRRDDAIRTTIYAFGTSERDGVCRGYSYKSEDGFEPRPLPAGPVAISPVPSFADYDVSTLEGWVDVACRLRHDRPDGKVVIGGDLLLTMLAPGNISVTRVHRFDDFDAQSSSLRSSRTDERLPLVSAADYTNEFGEEVFAYAASGWVNEKLTGVPVPLTGRLMGLSLMTEVLPGVGPVVQIPAGAFLPDKPKWDWVRQRIFPFGEPDRSRGIVESLLPAWAQKFQQAFGVGRDERAWNSTVMDVARWLVSTGDYDTSTVDGMNRLMDAARSKARTIYAIRGAAQFVAPTAPTPEWVVKDRNGDVQVAQMLVEDFQKMRDEDPNDAVLNFLDRYGEGVFLLMQGKTAEVTPGAPVSKEGADWERANGDIVERYPNVFGFFAPQGGDLDPSAFDRTVESGRRVPLTVDQYLRLANDRVANAVYQNVRRRFGPRPTEAHRGILRELRRKLIEAFPGYTDRAGVPERASTDTLIRDLASAAEDERLIDNAATRPLQIYLKARSAAEQASEARGLSPTGFRSSTRLADVRSMLRELGDRLSAVSPEFSVMWERVFDGELVDEQEEVAA